LTPWVLDEPQSLMARLAKERLQQISKLERETWQPYPIQQQLLCQRAFLVGFGGSGGGGKSAALLMSAKANHKKALILRRTYPNLRELIDRSREMFSSSGRYNAVDRVWRFSDGQSIELGTCQFEHNRENYRGREHSGLLIDEVTELPGGWATVQFLSGWVRSPDPDQHCQIVLTFNPPSTPESMWVLDVFGPWIDPTHDNPAASGEIRYFATIDGKDTEVEDARPFYLEGDTPVWVHKTKSGFLDDAERPVTGQEIIEPRSRTFIRAALDDNPALAQTGYRQTLLSLPEPLRSQLLYGDMSIRVSDDAWQVIPSAWVEAAFERWENSCPIASPLTCIGVDVARGGRDQTVLALRRGYWFESLQSYPGAQTPDGPTVAAQVAAHYEEGCAINIDVVGVGTTVYDILSHTYSLVTAIGGGEKSFKSDASGRLSFFNKRAEIYWLLREALDPASGINICLERDSRLKAELCAPRWSLAPPIAGETHKNGRIKIESKDQIHKRLGRSPDLADAVVYCWAEHKNTFVPIQYGISDRDLTPKVPEVQVKLSRPQRQRRWR
jgi:hypothetical protein